MALPVVPWPKSSVNLEHYLPFFTTSYADMVGINGCLRLSSFTRYHYCHTSIKIRVPQTVMSASHCICQWRPKPPHSPLGGATAHQDGCLGQNENTEVPFSLIIYLASVAFALKDYDCVSLWTYYVLQTVIGTSLTITLNGNFGPSVPRLRTPLCISINSFTIYSYLFSLSSRNKNIATKEV